MVKGHKERRGRRVKRDSGARTRQTDHRPPQRVWQDRITTFNLRRVEHLRRKEHDARPEPA